MDSMLRQKIATLQSEVEQLKLDMRRATVPAMQGSRRQPRLAITVIDYFATPQYPAAPNPAVYDEETGELITPADPHPNTFPFIYVDASFTQSAGLFTPTASARQTVPTTSSTHVGYVHNVNSVYIPQGSLIWIFEDNGYYWTGYNDTTSTNSSPSSVDPHGITRFMYLWSSVSTSVNTSSTSYQPFVWNLFWPDVTTLADFGLDWDSDLAALIATRDTTFFGHCTAYLQFTGGDSLGYTPDDAIEITHNLQPYGTDDLPFGANWLLTQTAWKSAARSSWPKVVTSTDMDGQALTTGQYIYHQYRQNHYGSSLNTAPLSIQFKLCLMQRATAHAS